LLRTLPRMTFPNPSDLGPGFRQARSSSRYNRRQQQVAASRQQEQGSRARGTTKCATRCQNGENFLSVHLSLLRYSVARRKHRENSPQQVKSTRASPLAFSPIDSQPRSFSFSPKMARNARCAFSVAMALGRAWQAAGETLTGKSGLPELAPLLAA